MQLAKKVSSCSEDRELVPYIFWVLGFFYKRFFQECNSYPWAGAAAILSCVRSVVFDLFVFLLGRMSYVGLLMYR